MTPLNFAIVGLRLFGIYFIVESGPLFAVGSLANAFFQKMDQVPGASQQAVFFSAWIPGGLLVFTGILLFIFSASLARRLAPPVVDESSKVTCSFEEIQAIAFAAAGIVIMANTFPSVGRAWENLYNYYAHPQSGNADSLNYLHESWMYAIGIFAQLILGLLLLLNSHSLAKLWRWLRTAGTGA